MLEDDDADVVAQRPALDQRAYDAYHESDELLAMAEEQQEQSRKRFEDESLNQLQAQIMNMDNDDELDQDDMNHQHELEADLPQYSNDCLNGQDLQQFLQND